MGYQFNEPFETTAHLTLRQIANLALEYIEVFIILLAAPLCKMSLIIQCHGAGQRGRAMPWSQSESHLWWKSLTFGGKTLIPVDLGTTFTYVHSHMVKIQNSHVKILKNSPKDPEKFSKLGQQDFLNC